MEEKKKSLQMITADSTSSILGYLNEQNVAPGDIVVLELAKRDSECKCVYYGY